jgi:multiple sugar transport system ATP-binding protein
VAVTEIVIDGVTKEFANGVKAVCDVSLTINTGEFMVLVGPSGCGKSTLLRMIAGLETVTDGRIGIGTREVTHLAPRHRNIAMVFQSYALYPHMTVEKNLGYGLRVRKVPKQEIARRVSQVAGMLRLDELLARRPGQLSGGQRQRVAMGRAIVREPAVYLMDEPLSNLDAKLRVTMRAELRRLHERLGTTTVYVTHDQTEAMTLGSRITVMREGTIQQVGTPEELYHHPVNVFVAGFIGSPSMNFASARVVEGAVTLGAGSVSLEADNQLTEGDDLIVGIRPHAFRLADDDEPAFDVSVAVVEELGAETHVLFWLDVDDARGETDDHLLHEDGRVLFTAVLSDETTSVGDRIRIAVDPQHLHFFDPHTGDHLAPPTQSLVAQNEIGS